MLTRSAPVPKQNRPCFRQVSLSVKGSQWQCVKSGLAIFSSDQGAGLKPEPNPKMGMQLLGLQESSGCPQGEGISRGEASGVRTGLFFFFVHDSDTGFCPAYILTLRMQHQMQHQHWLKPAFDFAFCLAGGHRKKILFLLLHFKKRLQSYFHSLS